MMHFDENGYPLNALYMYDTSLHHVCIMWSPAHFWSKGGHIFDQNVTCIDQHIYMYICTCMYIMSIKGVTFMHFAVFTFFTIFCIFSCLQKMQTVFVKNANAFLIKKWWNAWTCICMYVSIHDPYMIHTCTTTYPHLRAFCTMTCIRFHPFLIDFDAFCSILMHFCSFLHFDAFLYKNASKWCKNVFSDKWGHAHITFLTKMRSVFATFCSFLMHFALLLFMSFLMKMMHFCYKWCITLPTL